MISWNWHSTDDDADTIDNELPGILVIDDDEVDQMFINRLLHKIFGKDLKLDFVSNWDRAIAAVQSRQHDIYIIDQNLCAGTGLEIIERFAIKDDPKVFILLTGGENPEVDLAATRAGVADFLIKGDLTVRRLERSLRYATESVRQKRRLVDQANQLRDAKMAIEAEILKHQSLTAELRQVQDQLRKALERSEKSEQQQRWLAQHDALTKIPNRNLFDETLKHGLAEASRSGNPLALYLLDIDRFKQVNDTFGHQVGDALLIQIAERLKQQLRCSDIAARLGGDEFAVVATNVRDRQAASRLAEKMIAALASPFEISGHSIFSGTSIGISLSNDRDTDNPDAIMRAADAALYQAKSVGRGVFRFHGDEPYADAPRLVVANS